MRKLLLKRQLNVPRLQTAQGMVEFALVLPILLMLILGVFAFGHLFFVYSITVSASREAARYGAAVGVEASSGLPRYRDCNSIRQAARRIAGIVGVTDATVNIQYDHGPGNPSGTPPTVQNLYGSCPVAGTAPPEADMKLGDRIVVTITLPYQPIVPFINMPTIPVTAVTARTIIKGLPVGDAPVAVNPCTVNTTLLFEDLPDPSPSGQIVPIVAKIVTDNGTAAPGTLKVSDTTGNTCTSTNPSTGLPSSCSNFIYNGAAGTVVQLTIEYTSSDSCYTPLTTDAYHSIEIAPTQITILSPKAPPDVEGTSFENVPVPIIAKVEYKAPAVGLVKQGTVTFTDGDVSCTANVDTTTSIAQCSLPMRLLGSRTVTADFIGTAQFSPSTTTTSHIVVLAPTPTPVISPTPITQTPTPSLTPTKTVTPTRTVVPSLTHTPTITSTPTKTLVPAECPIVSDMIFQPDRSAVVFVIENPPFTAGNPTWDPAKIFELTINWEKQALAPPLDEIRYGPVGSTAFSCLDNTNPSICLWEGKGKSIKPPAFTANASNWTNPNPADFNLSAGTTKELRFSFVTDLNPGDYSAVITFSNGCKYERGSYRSVLQ